MKNPSAAQRACYALPNVAMAMLWTPLNVMQGVYIKYYGFSMGAIASILFLTRGYDAVADLVVGAVSDSVKARTGKRKPLFALGAIIFGVAGVFVYIPPATAGRVYLLVSLLAFFTGYATLMISHLAWGAELARDSRQKTEIFGLYKAAGYAGLCIFYSVPLLPVFATSDITPATMQWSVYLACAVLVPALWVCLRFVPEGATGVVSEAPDAVPRGSLQNIVANRSFLILMGAYLVSGSALGIWYGMIFIFLDIYLGKGALFAPLYLVAFSVGSISSLVWSQVARLVGKKRAWSYGMLLVLATTLATGLMTPRNANSWSVALLLITNTVGFVSFELLPGSILGDVADHSMLRSGRNQTAMFFSLYMFTTKALFALGGAVGLGLAAWLGFDPHLHEQGYRGVLALCVTMSWVPSAMLAASIMFIQCIPMDERRHAIVRKRLDQLEARRANSTRTDSGAGDQRAAAVSL